MKKITLVMSVLLVLVLTSCNKDQKAVKTLGGSWEEVSIDGTAVEDADKGVYKFEDCKLKTEEYCTATYTDSDGDSQSYTYKVEDKGERLVFKVEDPNFGSFEFSSNITELTESKLVLTTTLFGTTVTEYKKI